MSDLDALKILTDELHLSDQFDLARPLINVSIPVEVLSGSATIWALYREPGMAVIAFYNAERGTKLPAQVRSETWSITVLSGALIVEQEGKETQIIRRRDSFKLETGKPYTLSWEEDTRMVVVAIPDVKELAITLEKAATNINKA